MAIVNAEAVATWARLVLAGDDLAEMTSVIEAIEATLAETHTLPVIDEENPAPAGLVLAVKMLAARGYDRRNTPGGIAGFGADFVYRVSRDDPDIARALGPFEKFPVA